jgi:hypothetical protein
VEFAADKFGIGCSQGLFWQAMGRKWFLWNSLPHCFGSAGMGKKTSYA